MENPTVVIVTARDREYAKSKASGFLGKDPDKYIVEPIVPEGAKIHFDLSFTT